MKNEILIELARRWETESEAPETMDGSPEAREMNIREQAARETKRECADTLRTLVSMIG